MQTNEVKCIPPMLAKLGGEADLQREGHLFEPKLDGIRAICRKEGERLLFFNRHCVDITARYPEFQFAASVGAGAALLDGEIVLYDAAGNPDFTALMGRHHRGAPRRERSGDPALRYAVFDVLMKDGEDLCDMPLHDRKEVLKQTVGRTRHLEQTIFTTDGPRLWHAIMQRNLEGVMAKRVDGRYESGRRSGSWLKIKSFQTIDVVIVGFSSDKRALSSLGVALYDASDELQFIGKVGTGFTDQEIKTLRTLLDPLRIPEPPASGVPRSYKGIQWVAPKYVCELRFLEIGSQGMMRNPSYLRLRDDKAPEACRMDQVQ